MEKTKNKQASNGVVGESLSSTKNKRQIYLWDENKEFYDKLNNKSRLINLLIKKYREETE